MTPTVASARTFRLLNALMLVSRTARAIAVISVEAVAPKWRQLHVILVIVVCLLCLRQKLLIVLRGRWTSLCHHSIVAALNLLVLEPLVDNLFYVAVQEVFLPDILDASSELAGWVNQELLVGLVKRLEEHL